MKKNSIFEIKKKLLLEAPDDIFSFAFSPTEPNIIAGGCMNGQVVLWDIAEFEERIKNPRGDHRDKDLFIVNKKNKKIKSNFSHQFIFWNMFVARVRGWRLLSDAKNTLLRIVLSGTQSQPADHRYNLDT